MAIMVEKAYRLSQAKQKTVEKIIMDENIHYIHMVFGNGEGLPLHHANAPVYMTVVRGTLTVKLDDQETHRHENDTLLVIPAGTLMDVGNRDEELLELIVVKAPVPKG